VHSRDTHPCDRTHRQHRAARQIPLPPPHERYGFQALAGRPRMPSAFCTEPTASIPQRLAAVSRQWQSRQWCLAARVLGHTRDNAGRTIRRRRVLRSRRPLPRYARLAQSRQSDHPASRVACLPKRRTCEEGSLTQSSASVEAAHVRAVSPAPRGSKWRFGYAFSLRFVQVGCRPGGLRRRF
jgi:hypothetical protein